MSCDDDGSYQSKQTWGTGADPVFSGGLKSSGFEFYPV
jgi:hypothetical protein